MNPKDVLMYGHRTFVHTVEAFPRDHVYDPGACGYWSVKDLVCHLASFEVMLVEVLSNLIAPCPTPTLDEHNADPQAFNDHQVDRRKDLTFEQAFDEYHETHGQICRLMDRVPAAAFHTNGILPWYGGEYDLEDYLTYAYYGHKREHSGQIAVFTDRYQ